MSDYTPEYVARCAGLEHFVRFAEPLRDFARRYRCEARGTGRTTYMLCWAVAAALRGEQVVLAFPSLAMADRAQGRVRELLGKCRTDGAHVAEDRCCHLTLRSGGSLHFSAGVDAALRGVRVDLRLADHSASNRHHHGAGCLHRVRPDGRCCALCGVRLRGADLRQARLRRAMVRDQPELARKLGVL